MKVGELISWLFQFPKETEVRLEHQLFDYNALEEKHLEVTTDADGKLLFVNISTTECETSIP